MLLDTGCTTNIIYNTFFDWPPQILRVQMTPPEAEHGLTADGSLSVSMEM